MSVNDAVLVNSEWPFKSEDSEIFVKHLLELYPSSGITTESGQLCGWVLTYPYGAIGIMHVMPEFRRRGLAKAIVAHHIEKWTVYGWGCQPFCYIVDDNSASKSLFEALDFQTVGDIMWVGYCSVE